MIHCRWVSKYVDTKVIQIEQYMIFILLNSRSITVHVDPLVLYETSLGPNMMSQQCPALPCTYPTPPHDAGSSIFINLKIEYPL